MNDELTDPQRKALLRAEVQKLKAAGMDYDRAFSTASDAHPEWRATDPLLKRCRARRAEMANASPDRAAEIQRLVAAYQKDHPGATYSRAFTAIMNDPKNKALADSLHQPQRAFKPVQMNSGAGANTPPRSPAPKKEILRYGPGPPLHH